MPPDLIGFSEIKEKKIGRLFVNIFDSRFGNFRVGVTKSMLIYRERGRDGQVLRGHAVPPGCKRMRTFFKSVKSVEHSFDRSYLRCVGVRNYTVTLRVYAVKKRHMARRHHRRHNRSRRKQIGRFGEHFFGKRIVAAHHSIGAHSVNKHKYNFLGHFIFPRFNLFL